MLPSNHSSGPTMFVDGGVVLQPLSSAIFDPTQEQLAVMMGYYREASSKERLITWRRDFSMDDPVRLIFGIVDCVAIVFGLTLNALLIYLIKTRTVPAMRAYSRLLIMSCVMDLVLAGWTFLVEPIPCVDHGYRMVFLNGFFRNASQPVRYAVYMVWIQLMLFFLITTMAQYIYRYYMLCKNGEISQQMFWTLIVVNIGLNVVHGVSLGWADYPRAEDALKIAQMRMLVMQETGITDLNVISFVNAHEFRWILHIVIMFIMFPAFYMVIIICWVKIRRRINNMDVPKLREYNRQISSALLFQAFLPTLEVAAWCVQILSPVFFPTQNTVMAVVFSDLPIHFAPSLNPLGTILLVVPYRRAVTIMVRKWVGMSLSVSSSGPMPGTTQTRRTTQYKGNDSVLPHMPIGGVSSMVAPMSRACHNDAADEHAAEQDKDRALFMAFA